MCSVTSDASMGNPAQRPAASARGSAPKPLARCRPARMWSPGMLAPFAAYWEWKEAAMSTSKNKEAIRRLFAALGGDEAAIDAVVAPNYDDHVPAARAGRVLPIEALRHRIAGLRAAFPDLTVELEEVIGEEDAVAVRWLARGAHRGEYHGGPPTGKHVTIRGVLFAHMRDGKVAESWMLVDELGLREDLGIA